LLKAKAKKMKKKLTRKERLMAARIWKKYNPRISKILEEFITELYIYAQNEIKKSSGSRAQKKAAPKK